MGVFNNRVEAIREMMRSKGWDVVVLTGNDPHASEYSAPRWHQVAWVSGYTGEGELVITEDHAGLWTDTRYFIQAEKQLQGTGIELHKTRVQDQVLIPEWLAGQFKDYDEVVIAVDGLGISASEVGEIREAIGRDRTAIANVPDMLSPLWTDRPDIPQTPIITLGTETVGWSRKQKIVWLRKWLSDKGFDAILVSAPDEIAWMLNVRGNDVQYNPVVISYLLVTLDTTQWFVRKGPLAEDDHETEDSFYELTADGVNIQDYSDIGMALAGMVDDYYIKRLFVDSSTLNYNLYGILKENTIQDNVVAGKSPVALRKAVKNDVEIAGMREAHLEDGLAVERFLYWLEKMIEGGEPLNEYECSSRLHSFRSEIEGFRGESFETISAYGPSAALPHYVTPESGSLELFGNGLYLCDSGGQYLFGTTDITRTVPLGPCSQLEKEDYTLVLKGHIALSKAVFPKGTAGCQIDALARAPLWSSKRSFGHGVGFYLNVHEGPQEIRQNFNKQPMMPGMVTSIEPGIYREGRHGVRHENLVLCVDAGENEFGRWLRFEPLTLCHFDTSIIIKDLLDASEIRWLNDYNEKVYRTLSPRLSSEVAEWLRDKTLPI